MIPLGSLNYCVTKCKYKLIYAIQHFSTFKDEIERLVKIM